MASGDPWDEIGRVVIATQAKLREVWASGSMAVVEEVELRAQLANFLLGKFEHQGIPTDLYDAIHWKPLFDAWINRLLSGQST
jgi:hypothetical protein